MVFAYTLPADVVPGPASALFAVTSVLLIAVTNLYHALSGVFHRRFALYAPAGRTGLP